MKRLIAYFLAALLILAPVESFARTRLLTSAPVYKGTITGLRVSAVDGTAFIDNLPYTYSSDFSAGVDGWTGSRGTVAGDIDSIGGEDNWLRLTIDTQNDVHYANQNSIFTIGKQYTVSFRYYIPSGQTVLAGVQATGTTYQSTLGAATTVTYTWTATITNLRVYATSSDGSTVIQDAGGDDVFYIKDVTISEITPYMDGNHSIEIYDASNRMVKGVLKSQGTSEGLDSELFPSPTFDATTGWTTPGSSVITDGFLYLWGDSAQPYLTNTSILTIGALYKNISEITRLTATNLRILFGDTIVYYNTTGTKTTYATTVGNQWFTYTQIGDGNIDISSGSLKQVLTPSSSGATIVSAKAGETYNFSYKNPSFTYNAASYYCIIKPIR